MFGEASRFVIDKRKTPAFHILFQYARQSLASNCDIARRYAEQTSAIYATMNWAVHRSVIANHTRQAPFFAHLFCISVWTGGNFAEQPSHTYAKPNQNYAELL